MELGSKAKQIGFILDKHSPAILTSLACIGVVTTTVLAVKATPKALEEIKKEKEEVAREIYTDNPDHIFDEEDVQLRPLDLLRLTWKTYLPATMMGVSTIGLILILNRVHLHRTAAITAAYTIAESSLKNFSDKAIDVIGEKKVDEIREKVNAEKVEKNPVSKNEIYLTGSGDTLCYDTISGRYFKSDIETLRKIQNDLNKELIYENWISLNRLYSEIGLDDTKMGDDLGWVTDNLIEFKFYTILSDDGRPALVLDFEVDPKFDYYRSI